MTLVRALKPLKSGLSMPSGTRRNARDKLARTASSNQLIPGYMDIRGYNRVREARLNIWEPGFGMRCTTHLFEYLAPKIISYYTLRISFNSVPSRNWCQDFDLVSCLGGVHKVSTKISVSEGWECCSVANSSHIRVFVCLVVCFGRCWREFGMVFTLEGQAFFLSRL